MCAQCDPGIELGEDNHKIHIADSNVNGSSNLGQQLGNTNW